jgi:hypothetical protein
MIAAIRSFIRFLYRAFAAIGRKWRGPGDEFRKDGGVAAFRLLQNLRVREELGLNNEQIRQILIFTRVARQKRKKQLQALRSAEEKKPMAMARVQRQIAIEVLGNLNKAAVLTMEQKDRLRQLSWQHQGTMAFTNPLVAETLKLTPDQKLGVQNVLDEFNKRMRGQKNGENKKEEGSGPADLRKQTLEQALALLDADQKERWRQLKGKPFETHGEDASAGEADSAE